MFDPLEPLPDYCKPIYLHELPQNRVVIGTRLFFTLCLLSAAGIVGIMLIRLPHTNDGTY